MPSKYIWAHWRHNETLLDHNHEIDGLVQNCINSIADALELLQSCTKLSKYR